MLSTIKQIRRRPDSGSSWLSDPTPQDQLGQNELADALGKLLSRPINRTPRPLGLPHAVLDVTETCSIAPDDVVDAEAPEASDTATAPTSSPATALDRRDGENAHSPPTWIEARLAEADGERRRTNSNTRAWLMTGFVVTLVVGGAIMMMSADGSFLDWMRLVMAEFQAPHTSG